MGWAALVYQLFLVVIYLDFLQQRVLVIDVKVLNEIELLSFVVALAAGILIEIAHLVMLALNPRLNDFAAAIFAVELCLVDRLDGQLRFFAAAGLLLAKNARLQLVLHHLCTRKAKKVVATHRDIDRLALASTYRAVEVRGRDLAFHC